MNIFPCRFFSNYICLCDVLYPSFIRCDTFFQFHVRLRLKQEKLLHQLGLGFLESWYNLGLVSNIISLVRELFPPKQLHEIKTTFGEGERKISVIIRPWLGWGRGLFRNHLLHKIMISTLQPNHTSEFRNKQWQSDVLILFNLRAAPFDVEVSRNPEKKDASQNFSSSEQKVRGKLYKCIPGLN